jgi:Ca2+-binding EF-hand superfamily protein
MIGIAVAGLVVSMAGDAVAKPPPGARFRHADRNKDGKISAREYKAEKRWEHKQKAKVNTPREARIDKDNDGVVEPAEVRQAKAAAYLKNRSTVNRPWEAKADANGDGTVSAAELRAHHVAALDKNGDGTVDRTERKAYWVHRKAKVNTEVEKKYDADGNGWISGEEAREMLRDRLRIINTHGKAKVNTALEEEFDANGDGVIDRVEARALREAVQD